MVTTSSNLTYTIPVNNGSTSQIYVSAGGVVGGGVTTAYSNSINNTVTKLVNNKGTAVMEIPASEDPSVKINGKINWNGMDLEERLSTIEKTLNIPTRDIIMEEKYAKLRDLSNQYKQALEEYKTWERLKNSK